MENLIITVIQSDVHWENTGANLAMWEEKIWQISGPTDVIILPEMFTTGFTMNAAAHAEAMNMKTSRWMKQMASQTGALVLGSFIAREGHHYYNRLLWMQPDGNFKAYDKRHLFRMANEDDVYTAGGVVLIGEWKGWRICPLICYDLRFPVWSRNRLDLPSNTLAYDLLVYVANWPQVRIHAWETLLTARAIENLSYVVGVNRIGIDGNGIGYNGKSTVVNPVGETLFTTEAACVHNVSLDPGALIRWRERFPAFRDSDGFTLDATTGQVS
jgi:omega-amidase